MPPVRRHRIGDQMPAVSHAGPDPNAIALCQDLVAEAAVDGAILFGSRARGGWDEQSDLDIIVIHQSVGDEGEERSVVGHAMDRLRELHYPGYLDYENPHHGVVDGLIVETPEDYRAHRRTLNDVIARAAREGLVFCKEPGTEHRYRHDGDVSNEWELVTRKRLCRAASTHRSMELLRGLSPWYSEGDPPARRDRINVHTNQGRDAYRLLWNSGAALLSIMGAVYPRDSVAEMVRTIVEHDAGWRHDFRSDLDRIDQYSGCGCEVVVTDPIDDVPAMWRDLEVDRDALWKRIRALSGNELALTLEEHDNRH